LRLTELIGVFSNTPSNRNVGISSMLFNVRTYFFALLLHFRSGKKVLKWQTQKHYNNLHLLLSLQIKYWV